MKRELRAHAVIHSLHMPQQDFQKLSMKRELRALHPEGYDRLLHLLDSRNLNEKRIESELNAA
ncbi:MAG: hypothetical protein DRJ67_09235 [Thermoprotei archaeon]|nr:MAG: hypothetical protein DRJ67_09235 [Thermoprotei archaeon]